MKNRPPKSAKKLRNDRNQPATVGEDSIENLNDSVKGNLMILETRFMNV